jgi:hypothetical protein
MDIQAETSSENVSNKGTTDDAGHGAETPFSQISTVQQDAEV